MKRLVYIIVLLMMTVGLKAQRAVDTMQQVRLKPVEKMALKPIQQPQRPPQKVHDKAAKSTKKTARKAKKSVEFLKVAVVCFVLFWGSMLTLMTFHNEASIPEVFANIHQLLTGEETARPLVLILSYTAGIALGIGCFFNHFGKKKLTDDPTPVQVEFVSYKKQIDDAIVDELEEQRH